MNAFSNRFENRRHVLALYSLSTTSAAFRARPAVTAAMAAGVLIAS